MKPFLKVKFFGFKSPEIINVTNKSLNHANVSSANLFFFDIHASAKREPISIIVTLKQVIYFKAISLFKFFFKTTSWKNELRKQTIKSCECDFFFDSDLKTG